jgi:hypothetical protein
MSNPRDLPLMENPEEISEPYVTLADLLDDGGADVVRYGDQGPLVTLDGTRYEVVLRKIA